MRQILTKWEIDRRRRKKSSCGSLPVGWRSPYQDVLVLPNVSSRSVSNTRGKITGVDVFAGSVHLEDDGMVSSGIWRWRKDWGPEAEIYVCTNQQ